MREGAGLRRRESSTADNASARLNGAAPDCEHPSATYPSVVALVRMMAGRGGTRQYLKLFCPASQVCGLGQSAPLTQEGTHEVDPPAGPEQTKTVPVQYVRPAVHVWPGPALGSVGNEQTPPAPGQVMPAGQSVGRVQALVQ